MYFYKQVVIFNGEGPKKVGGHDLDHGLMWGVGGGGYLLHHGLMGGHKFTSHLASNSIFTANFQNIFKTTFLVQ